MSSPFIGEIRMFGGTFAPQGWALCDGRSLSISSYETLYTLIGTTYGGDGVNNFNLPDLRGRMPVHQGSGFVLGQMAGTESVTLTALQLPVHNHFAQALNGAATRPAPSGSVWASSTTLIPYSSGAPSATMSNSAIAPAGSSLPHENMMPFQAINFIIALQGIYPSQN